jgi:hypothetical protein
MEVTTRDYAASHRIGMAAPSRRIECHWIFFFAD